jgi:hypothetical protein
MVMQNTRGWWEQSFLAIVAIAIVGVGAQDMISRLPTQIALPLDIILIILGLLILYKLYRDWKLSRKTKVSVEMMNPDVKTIESPKMPRHLPSYYNIILIALALFAFLGATAEVAIWIHDKISFDTPKISFLIASYTGSIFVFYDTLFTARKQKLLGQSYVWAGTSFRYKADNIEDVFDKCYKTLDMMCADSPTQMKRPTLIERPLKNSYITVKIIRKKKGVFNIDVESDAKMVETRLDWGRNKRNISEFKRLMLQKQSEPS